ncbi:MAG TPA: amidase family protein, partial [Longimicrobiales bacterium]
MLVLSGVLLLGGRAAAQSGARRGGFDVVETTIAQVHSAMRAHRLTAHQLVQAYLDRIAAYDHAGPNLNALILVNPRALALADSLDALYARTGQLVGPLHGIPVIVKDNYDTFDLPTTVGCRCLHGATPPRDATMVAKIRAAGAIVLAKSNMAEFAFSPNETISSELPGYTFNPYALNRVPAGSSGGTAAAVAANLGETGLGTDTGNSIRGPSSHDALVGIRPTIGLTSRAGIAPLYLERDVGGPMARTVEDAATMLDVLAGADDPRDTATARAAGHIPPTYTAFLKRDALKGARIGVARNISNRTGADAEVLARFQQALVELRKAGATVVDSVNMSFMDSIPVGVCHGFRHDIEAYLAERPEAPVHTLPEILASRKFHPSILPRLEAGMADTTSG